MSKLANVITYDDMHLRQFRCCRCHHAAYDHLTVSFLLQRNRYLLGRCYHNQMHQQPGDCFCGRYELYPSNWYAENIE
jgi:hypothetical protein